MSTRNLLVSASVALGLMAATASASAQASTTDPKFRWNGRVAAGQTVEIRGLNGKFTDEHSNGTEVEVIAAPSARRSDAASVTFEAIPHAGGITICSVYP